MVTETAKDMQQSLATFNEILNRYLMKINIKKTKVMVNIQLDNQTIDQVNKYSGSTLTSDSKCSVEIRHRIAMVKREPSHKKS